MLHALSKNAWRNQTKLKKAVAFHWSAAAQTDGAMRRLLCIVFKGELKAALSTSWAPNLNSAHWETPSSLI